MSDTATPAAPASTESQSTETAPASASATSNTGKPAEASVQAAVTPAKRKLSYKLGEQDVTEELTDAEIEAAAVAYRRKDKAADLKFQDAAKARKEVEQALRIAKTDPKKALQALGLNPREVAEALLMAELEEEKLNADPVAKRQRELEQKLKHYETQEQEQKRLATAQKHQALVQQEQERIATTIKEALTEPGMPQGAWAVKRIATLMTKNSDLGLDLTAKEIAQIVKEEALAEHKAMLLDMTPEQTLALYGDSWVNKLRQADLARLRAVPSSATAPGDPSAVVPKQSGDTKIPNFKTKRELDAHLAKIRAGKE